MFSKTFTSSWLAQSLSLSFALITAPAIAEMADWEIDAEHFSIVFEAGHIGYQQQLGFFLEGSGSFRYNTETQEFSGGRVEVKADSLFSNHDDRDDHLKSRDFLNARRNPLIVFEAAEFIPGEEGQAVLKGNLTMLDKTNPVELQLTVNKQARYPFGHRQETLGISARATIFRSQWGMDYGISNNLVGDEVKLRFEFEAIRQ